jgi:membrane protease YdiL (CAAX protease family)
LSRLVLVWAVLFVIAFMFAYSNGLFHPLTQVGVLSRIGTIVGAPVAEELVFRGALITSLNRTQLGVTRVLKVPVSVAVGAVIYSVIHLIIFALSGFSFADAVVSSVSALVMGLVFGVLYVRTENVWYGVFLHALINFGHWG